MERIQEAISLVEESMRQEGKSTAGDKHNTARANMQLERERLGQSLLQLEQMSSKLDRIHPDEGEGPIRAGSLVTTSTGRFYLAVAVDPLETSSGLIHMVGLTSPLAVSLLGKSQGEKYVLNGREHEILKAL